MNTRTNPIDDESALAMAIRLQNGLIARATGVDGFDGGDPEYQELRRFFASRPDTKAELPDFVHRCRDLSQFWGFIKSAYGAYAERRAFIWEAFRPLLDHLRQATTYLASRQSQRRWRNSTPSMFMRPGRRHSTAERPILRAPLQRRGR
jgi:hypothetical protein